MGKGRRPGVQAGEHFSLFAEASINGAKSPSFPPSFSAISLIFNICRRESAGAGDWRILRDTRPGETDGGRQTDILTATLAHAHSLKSLTHGHFFALLFMTLN